MPALRAGRAQPWGKRAARRRPAPSTAFGGSIIGARYYAPWLGRWTTADPSGIAADGPNLYAFVRGSPVTLVDPDGRESTDKSPAEWIARGSSAAADLLWSTDSAGAPARLLAENDTAAADAAANRALVDRLGTKEAITSFEVETLSRPRPKGETSPSFLRGFFREMTDKASRRLLSPAYPASSPPASPRTLPTPPRGSAKLAQRSP